MILRRSRSLEGERGHERSLGRSGPGRLRIRLRYLQFTPDALHHLDARHL